MNRIPVFVLIFLIFNNLHGSHILGGYIRYDHLGGSKYKLTGVVFRDCRGLKISAPDFGVFAGTSGGNSCGTSSLTGFTLKSIREITPLCPSDTPQCDPQNTYGAGWGIEEFIYEKVIDFSLTPFSGFISNSSCCDITFYMGWSKRTGFTSGCQFGTAPCDDYFTVASLNICNLRKCLDTTNSSPVQKSAPIFFPSCNQMLMHSTGFSDPDPDDSLKFYTVCPISSLPKTSVTYSSPFSCKYFMTPFCVPSSTIQCSPNRLTSPPRGIYFDSITGDLVVTPVNCTELFTFVPEGVEYRKDTSGNWLVIGKSRRDYAIYVQDYGTSNIPPTVSGTTISNVCAGDKLCIQIFGKDETFTPYQTVPDTVHMYWDSAISSATFSVINPTSREKTAEFCWQTHDSNVRETAYRFTVYASDNHCSPPQLASKTFLVRVNPRLSGSMHLSNSVCGELFLTAKKDSLFTDSAIAYWIVKDTTGQTLHSGIGFNDTALIHYGGKYFIQLTLRSFDNCSFTMTDSIIMPSPPSVWLGHDTQVCYSNSIRLTPKNIYRAKSPLKFQWKINGISIPSDTLDEKVTVIYSDTTVILTLTDSVGCKFSDSILIVSKPLPLVNIGKDQRICSGNFALVESVVSPIGGTYSWSTGDSTKVLKLFSPGIYILNYTDSFNHCSAHDTTEIFVNDSISVTAGPDLFFCQTAAVNLKGLYQPDVYPVIFKWWSLDQNALLGTGQSYWFYKSNQDTNLYKDSVFRIILTADVTQNGLTCHTSDSMKITIHSSQKAQWSHNLETPRCVSAGKLLLEDYIVKPDSHFLKNGAYRIYSLLPPAEIIDSIQPDWHDLIPQKAIFNQQINQKEYRNQLVFSFVDSNGCTSADTSEITLLTGPWVVLDTGYYCQNKKTVELDSIVVRPKTKSGNTYYWTILQKPNTVDNDSLLKFNSKTQSWELYIGESQDNHFSGNYNLELKVTDKATGCISIDSTQVKIYPEARLSSSNPDPFCDNHSVILNNIFLTDNRQPANDKTEFIIYAFNGYTEPDSFGQSVISGRQLSNPRAGLWSVALTNSEYGCPEIDTFDFQVVHSPKAEFSVIPGDTLFFKNTHALFNNKSRILSADTMFYVWYFEYPSLDFFSDAYSPEYTYTQVDSTYRVRLIASTSNCSDTSEKTITVLSGQNNLSYPFKPLKPQINSRFQISGVEFQSLEICVYDAAGRLVACRKDNLGMDLIPGTYFYRLMLNTGESTVNLNGKIMTAGR